MPDDLERLAFDLSLRALGQQEKVLEELRARTGTLLTAAALVTSFLGAGALRDTHRGLALGGFAFAVASILVSVYVLSPKNEFDFALSGPAVYEHFTEADASLADTHRTIAYWNQTAWESNQIVIDNLIGWFRRGCASLVLAIAAWSLTLTLH